MRQILVNLLSNAVKFAEEGEAFVAVDCGDGAASPPRELQFSVCDTGIGIPPDRFDVAVLDMVMPELDGLTLAAEIRSLQEHLPLAMLTSGQWEAGGEGSVLAALLAKPIKPSHLYDTLLEILARETGPLPRRGSERESLFDRAMALRLPLRILVAEDNVINQQVALSFLERLGYRADVAANGLEVLASLRRQPYDMVLMDVQMPEMDGLEATRCTRQFSPAELATQVQPRIIAMTANALKEDWHLPGCRRGRLFQQANPARGVGRRPQQMPVTPVPDPSETGRDGDR